jgi:hypothetical protein
VQLLVNLGKGVSVKWLNAEFGVGTSTRYALEPEVCLFDSHPSQVRGPGFIVEFEIASNLCAAQSISVSWASEHGKLGAN